MLILFFFSPPYDAVRDYKNNAKKRGICWDLTDKQFNILTKQRCFYCNREPKQIIVGPCTDDYTQSGIENAVYIYNGIDRVDNTKGYTIDNVVSCCKHCNRSKDILSQNEFIEFISKIYYNLVRKGMI